MLLLGLANVLDIAEEIRDPFGIGAKSYENMYGWIPSRYKRNNFSQLVWRNLRTGYIEKILKDGKPYFRLTSSGKNKITRDFPLLKLHQRKWDRKWRIVIFDIEEVNRQTRERFRHKLKELGFGMLQESVFISPYDIARDFAEFIESQGLKESSYVLEVSNIVLGDIRLLVNKVWGLAKINNEYESIIQKIEENNLISNSDRINKLNNDMDGEKIKDIAKVIWNKYLEIVLEDPFLPKDLLPLDWEGERVRIMVKRMRVIIEKRVVSI